MPRHRPHQLRHLVREVDAQEVTNVGTSHATADPHGLVMDVPQQREIQYIRDDQVTIICVHDSHGRQEPVVVECFHRPSICLFVHMHRPATAVYPPGAHLPERVIDTHELVWLLHGQATL